MILRTYQTRALSQAREAVRQGSRAVCIVAPTGAGKTIMGAEIARGHVERGGTVLWLVHRHELADQARAKLPEGVRIATIQGLLASGERPAASLVVFDEAHHVVADEWRTVADHYAPALRIGLTATPERADGTPLGDLFTSMVVSASYSELLAGGHLVPCDLIAPDRREASLAMPVAEALDCYARNRQALIFCATVAEARAVGECVDGETPGETRRDVVSRFRSGELRVLSSVYCLSEGFDVPAAAVAILARGFGHASSYLQAVGRVLRPSPGKRHALVVDLVGSSLDHGLPTEDRAYSLDGGIAHRSRKDSLWGCKACGLYLESPPPDRLCPSCGARMPEPKALVVARRRLARKEHDAVASPAEKEATLQRLVELGRARGYKPGWAASVYFGRFGHWPARAARERRGNT